MVKEIIKSIVDAEKQAEQIVAQANEKANAIIYSAEVEVEKINQSSVDELKKLSASTTVQANKDADINAEKVFLKGKEQADALAVKFQDNSKKAVEEIIGRLI